MMAKEEADVLEVVAEVKKAAIERVDDGAEIEIELLHQSVED